MTGVGAKARHCGPLHLDLYDLYVQYKQDTRAVIRWLISHGTIEQQKSSALSINDLFSLSQAACAKKVEMPDTIGFLFRKVIEARQHLSNFFKTSSADGQLDKDTQNHEHFTGRYMIVSRCVEAVTLTSFSSLTVMYNELCKCCAKPKANCTKAKRQPSSTWSSGAPGNRFADLKIEEMPLVDQQSSSESRICAQRPPNKENHNPKSDDTTPALIDDSLGEVLELRETVQVDQSTLPEKS